MFWNRTPVVEEVNVKAKTYVQPTKPEPKPKPVIAVPKKHNLEFDAEYYQLYTKLGIGLGLPTYPLSSVISYLDSKFPPADNLNKGWVWVPLRHKDIVKGRSFNDTENRTYTKPIPFPVLKTIDEIQTAHPEAKSFISDERQTSDNKDPFLLVTLDDGRTLNVIERWDEPSYR
jgi:hypothetical protein